MINEKLLTYCISTINDLSQSYLYKNWDDGFSRIDSKNAFKKFYELLNKENIIDLNSLTKEEALQLKFDKWDDKSDLYLIPLYMVPLIPKGTKLVCIDGKTITFNDIEDIDLDIRFGCISYGINIKEKKYKEVTIEISKEEDIKEDLKKK